MKNKIEAKVLAGERISEEECLYLYEHPDLFQLGKLASTIKQRLHGNKVYYNINRHLNYSNVCYVACKFCEFGQPKKSAKAYELTVAEMRAKAVAAAKEGATELHIVGGLHPDYKLEYYEDLLRTLKATLPHVHLKAFTAVEIDYFSKVSKVSVQEVLQRLLAAGLGSMPGGGAEILTDRMHELTFKNKIKWDRWLAIHEMAHGTGIRSNATMLYGIGETLSERVEHLKKLRDLQDKTHGFQTFIPLSFVPFETPLSHLPEPTGIEDLTNIAVARIFLDNFSHIKVYWIMTGVKVAQLALQFGADDFDGTVMQETIVHMAGADSPEGLTVRELQALITEAGAVPVERDTLYQPVSRAGLVA